MASKPRTLRRPAPLSAAQNGRSRGVIFDFDGTLVDSYPLIEEAFAVVMRRHRLDPAAHELFRKSRGLPLPEQMKLIAPDLWEDLVATYREADAGLGHAQVFRGIPTLMRKLRRAGAPLAVVSSKRRMLVDAELEAVALRPYFDVVIGFEDVTPAKPAPDPLLEAIARLGVSRAQALYVGDSMVDLTTGRAARVRTVLAAWGLSPELRRAFRWHRLWAIRPSEMLALALLPSPNGHRHRRLA